MKPCCFAGNQCQNLFPDDYDWCAEQYGTLGPEGACCANPTAEPPYCEEPNSPCWHCEWEVSHGFEVASCCFDELPGGLRWLGNEFAIWPEQCLANCGGTPYVSEEDCQVPPREQECIEAAEDRLPYPDAPRWTLDTMGTVVFGLGKVTEDFPADWPQGYTYGLSIHLTRPREPDTPVDACGHAVGRLTMLDDGYVYMETCSLPDVNNLDSHRRSYGVLWTAPETDPRIGIEKGYQYWVTCIRLPAWTELLYRSHQLLCTSEPE